MFEEWCWQDAKQARRTPQVSIKKFKKAIKGKMRYFYQKIDKNGEVLYESVGYTTRDGRNKAVRKAMQMENIKIIEE